MRQGKLQDWLQVVRNLAILVGIAFVVIELRQNQADLQQNRADLGAANEWQMAATSISTEEYMHAIEPSRDRATYDEVFAEIIRRAPMPEDLTRDLLGG